MGLGGAVGSNEPSGGAMVAVAADEVAVEAGDGLTSARGAVVQAQSSARTTDAGRHRTTLTLGQRWGPESVREKCEQRALEARRPRGGGVKT